MNPHSAPGHNTPDQTDNAADWLEDYIENMLLDARNGDINVERDAHQVAAHIRAGIRDDIVNGEGNWPTAQRDTPLGRV